MDENAELEELIEERRKAWNARANLLPAPMTPEREHTDTGRDAPAGPELYSALYRPERIL